MNSRIDLYVISVLHFFLNVQRRNTNVLTFRFPTMKSPFPIIHGAKVCSENTTNVLFTPHCPLPKKRRVCRNSLAYLKIIFQDVTVWLLITFLPFNNYSKITEATIRILLLPTYLLAEWAPSLEKIPYPRDRDIFVWMGHWKHLDHRRCRDHFQVPN